MGWSVEGYDGRTYELDERRYRQHILPNHGEMSGRLDAIRETVRDPDLRAESKRDREVVLLYRKEEGGYVCVVVQEPDAFVLTAYITARPKPQASSVS